MANAYLEEAGSELTPHQQSQLNQLAASIGYGSQLNFSTEEKGVGKQHVDGSTRVNDKGEPDRFETLAEQQRRLRRNRHGREDEGPTQLKHDGENLHHKKNETETKKQSTDTADRTGASACPSPVARASNMTESRNQSKSSPDSNTEEEEWDYRKARRIIGRHLRRMAEQEQVALLEENQKKASKARGPGKTVRAKKAKSAESLMKIKKKRKPYTKKSKDPPPKEGAMPAATSSGKHATVQQEAQAPKRIDESGKNDESKSAA